MLNIKILIMKFIINAGFIMKKNQTIIINCVLGLYFVPFYNFIIVTIIFIIEDLKFYRLTLKFHHLFKKLLSSYFTAEIIDDLIII